MHFNITLPSMPSSFYSFLKKPRVYIVYNACMYLCMRDVYVCICIYYVGCVCMYVCFHPEN
jgi:hypothetical protein